tara:strand:- start:1043 stop:1396 length:354 start_codon:yes stop_codon:yes gene_type:complete
MAFTTIGQGKLTFVKTILPKNVTSITSSTEYSTEIIPYDGDFIRLVVSIETNTNENILKQLFRVGRYNISIIDGVITFDNLKKNIYIKGEKLLEDILLKIQVPIGTELQIGVNTLLN